MAEPASDPTASWWRRAAAALPMRLALLAVAVVWLLGCVWSFEEQTAFAASRHFALPQLLPLVIDGFAAAMAGVAWAASLDARPAIAARLATLIAVTGSAASNGTWAWIRTGRDLAAVVLAVAVPLAANLAFEVLLAELRRQVQRRRGLPAPVAIPHPRLLRLALAPSRTLREWRALVLDLTALTQPPDSNQLQAASVASEPMRASRKDGAAQLAEASLPPVEASAEVEAPPKRAPRSQPEMPEAAPVAPDRPMIGDRRLDPRAAELAVQLRSHSAPDAVTGERVGDLLGIDLAPRTGRRLLGQARMLLNQAGRDSDPVPATELREAAPHHKYDPRQASSERPSHQRSQQLR